MYVLLARHLPQKWHRHGVVFHVFAALAEFERNLIRERTVAGLKAARARGRKGGRPAKLSAFKLYGEPPRPNDCGSFPRYSNGQGLGGYRLAAMARAFRTALSVPSHG